MTDSWTYTAPVVASWARARSRGKARFTDPRHAAALECHRLHALAARPRGWRTDGVYVVAVSYCAPDRRRRDVDRVLSLVIDALIGVAYDDDSDRYLAGAHVSRLSGGDYLDVADSTRATIDPGTTRVRVTRIGDAPPETAAKRRRRAAK